MHEHIVCGEERRAETSCQRGAFGERLAHLRAIDHAAASQTGPGGLAEDAAGIFVSTSGVI